MTFDPKALIAEQVEAIRKSVPGKAIIACSGGVDSTTAAVLASHALGDRLLAVYVDTGLMRKDETEDVARTLKELKVNHRILRATDEFFAALRGISDPEKKRVIIGNKFIELFEREAKTFGADFLETWGLSVPQQLDFADGRAKIEGAPRFVYVGPRRSLTGLNADEWIACKPGSELAIAAEGRGDALSATRTSAWVNVTP